MPTVMLYDTRFHSLIEISWYISIYRSRTQFTKTSFSKRLQLTLHGYPALPYRWQWIYGTVYKFSDWFFDWLNQLAYLWGCSRGRDSTQHKPRHAYNFNLSNYDAMNDFLYNHPFNKNFVEANSTDNVCFTDSVDDVWNKFISPLKNAFEPFFPVKCLLWLAVWITNVINIIHHTYDVL